MLRENKTMVITGIVFLLILVGGAWLLRSNRGVDVPPAYAEESSDPAQEYPSDTTPQPERQPITATHDTSTCRCIETNYQPTRNLSPPRNRHDPVQAVVFYAGHSNMLLEADGNLWGWGSNEWGQLGDGSSGHRNIPIKILDSVISVTPGGGSAIRADGSLWVWGMTRTSDPWADGVSIITPRHLMDDVIAFYQDDRHDLAITSDGSLWVWYHAHITTTIWWGIHRWVPDVEIEPIRVLNSVTGVYFSGNTIFARQCNGGLWAIRGTTAHHIMDAVMDVHVPGINPFMGRGHGHGQMQDTLVTQTDGSLWRVRYTQTQPSISHVMDDVAAVYRSYQSDFVIQTNGTLWGTGTNQTGSGIRFNRSNFTQIMENVASVIPTPMHDSTFVITTDGSLWGWGRNDAGQLGDGTLVDRATPVLIMDFVVSVHPYWGSTFVIRNDGSLWGWGMNWGSALGDGTTEERLIPVHIMDDVAEVVQTGFNTFALTTDSDLWGWGLGFGDGGGNTPLPTLILASVDSIQKGGSPSLYFIQDDGNIWAWETIFGGQPGAITWGPRNILVNMSYVFSYADGIGTPPSLGYISNVTLSPGNQRRCPPFMAFFGWQGDWAHFYVDENSRLWGWGYNWSGQVGAGIDNEFVSEPIHIMDSVVDVHVNGWAGIYALQANGDLWVWGGMHGNTPILTMHSVVAFYSQFETWFALMEDGSLWGWGSNWHGQLGDGTLEHREQPVQIMSDVVRLQMGANTHFALQSDGSLWSWGANTMGVLGDGSLEVLSPWVGHETDNISLPTMIMGQVADFHISGNSAFAIQIDGTLWAWGDNSAGQLGDGTRTNRQTPTRLMDGVRYIYAHGASVFASRSDGSLWAWGWNALGQLGDGTNISRTSPVRITVPTIIDMYNSSGITFAVCENNTLWAWGRGFGNAPVHVMDAVAFVLRGPRNRHFVMQIDGNLWVIGDSPDSLEFIVSDTAAVYAVDDVYFVIRTGGELIAWGTNTNRRLGEYAYVPQDNPVMIKNAE